MKSSQRILKIFFSTFYYWKQNLSPWVYRPPNKNNFVDKISGDFNKLLPEEKEIYVLGNFNINILFNLKATKFIHIVCNDGPG